MTREQAVSALQASGVQLDPGHGTVEQLHAQIRAARAVTAEKRKRRKFGRYGQCLRKCRYPNPETAALYAKRGGNPEVKPYHCRYCGGWHNGKAHRV